VPFHPALPVTLLRQSGIVVFAHVHACCLPASSSFSWQGCAEPGSQTAALCPAVCLCHQACHWTVLSARLAAGRKAEEEVLPVFPPKCWRHCLFWRAFPPHLTGQGLPYELAPFLESSASSWAYLSVFSILRGCPEYGRTCSPELEPAQV